MQIDSIGMREIFGDHWAMECNQARRVGEIGQQRRDVAVADDNLRICLYLGEVNFFEQVIRSIASAGANDGPDLGAAEHVFQFSRSPLRQSCKIEVLFENGVEVERFVPELL